MILQKQQPVPSRKQKKYPRWNWLRICIKNASFKLHLLWFSCFNSLFASHFSKMFFLLERGTHFCKTTSSNFNQFFCFFDPQMASMRAFFVIVFALFALLPVPIAIFSLHARIKIALLAAVPCIFRPQSPFSKNECMHRCNNFVNFVYDLLFYLCLPCFKHLFLQNIILFSENMLPALGGKHDFESGTTSKS